MESLNEENNHNNRVFLFSWDCYGLEALINLTEMQETQFVEILSNTHHKRSNKMSELINMLQLRARFNPQRHYEIYAIECDGNLTEDDLRHWFNKDPQSAADLIRQRGAKFYSDRKNMSDVKIT